MPWLIHNDKPHHCEPPMEQAYSDVAFLDKCAVNSWDDIWFCGECGKYWRPHPYGLTSSWVELKGLRLRWRLWRFRLWGPR